MLSLLSIRNIVLIEALELEVGKGLSVLTGETGAGKSILLDAFGLCLGARGDASLVRQGEPQGQVTAIFDLAEDHQVFDLLKNNDITIEDQLFLKRIQTADGKTRAYINDEPVTVQFLKSVGSQLVEIHGQHESRALLDADTHRNMIDGYAGLSADVRKVAKSWDIMQKALETLQIHEARLAEIRERADYLQHAFEELDKIQPLENEEEELAVRRQVMMNAEKVVEDLRLASNALSLSGGLNSLKSAQGKLERHPESSAALTEPVLKALEQVMLQADEANDVVEEALRQCAFEPYELEQTEERLFALRAMARKHKVPVIELPQMMARISDELEALDAGENKLDDLKQALSDAEDNYKKVALSLSEKRHKAAEKLDKLVTTELPPLKLEKAKFVTRLETVDVEDGGRHGIDRASFMVQTNPGSRAGPMAKVASGGELSRFMLALKVVLARKTSVPTLIFDEIDAGVGGATASAIGARLAELGTGLQVLCVTHAPQVAALASGHMKIAKDVKTVSGKQAKKKKAEEKVVTSITVLASGDRVEEIARMLAGATVTKEARAAAEKLMLPHS